ncbi:MAG: hypothetical protein M3P08_08865 [Thermoproteota archaeon]|jgi:hypothetical protein|nr:hypothetical protein [Thermoproteota archaeon]
MTPHLGDRIRLIHTNDRYTKLKHGDLGSITDVTYLPEDWGSNLGTSGCWFYSGINRRARRVGGSRIRYD